MQFSSWSIFKFCAYFMLRYIYTYVPFNLCHSMSFDPASEPMHQAGLVDQWLMAAHAPILHILHIHTKYAVSMRTVFSPAFSQTSCRQCRVENSSWNVYSCIGNEPVLLQLYSMAICSLSTLACGSSAMLVEDGLAAATLACCPWHPMTPHVAQQFTQS